MERGPNQIQAAIASEDFEGAVALLQAVPSERWQDSPPDALHARLQELQAHLLLARTFRVSYQERLSRLQRVQPYLDASAD